MEASERISEEYGMQKLQKCQKTWLPLCLVTISKYNACVYFVKKNQQPQIYKHIFQIL